MPKWFIALMTALFALSFVGCGEEESDDEATAALESGEWITACHEDRDKEGDDDDDDDDDESFQLARFLSDDDDDDDDDGDDDDDDDDDGPEYRKTSVDFTDGEFTYLDTMYSDSECQTSIFSMSFSGDYKTGDDAASETDVEDATELDIKISALEVTPLSDGAVEQFTSVCEDATVTKGTAIDFADCDFGDGDDNGPSIGDTYYTIFIATDSKLWMGSTKDPEDDEAEESENDGSTAAKREVFLDPHAMNKE